MKPPEKAIILAAGMSTRMQPLSLDTPKPIMPLWGRPILGHLFKLLARWGVKEVCVNLHFNPSPICRLLKDESKSGLKIAFSFESEILGTGGVLRKAGWFMDDNPFWMINADIAADLDARPLLNALNPPKTVAALWLEPKRGPRTVEARRGNIVNFQSSRPGTRDTCTFCGLQLISPALFNYLPKENFFSIIRVYENAMRAGRRIGGVCVPGSYWADMGTPESYLKAHAEIFDCYRKKLPGGILFDPRQARLNNALRKKGAIINGFASIDASAGIEPGARITDSVIWPRAVITGKAVIENAIVGSGCKIDGRVPRVAVRPIFETGAPEQTGDVQLNMALARLKLAPSDTTIIPFEPRGSARTFTRISGNGKNCIMIRYSLQRTENGFYAGHAGFLSGLGLNVPEIIADFPERQFVLIQDLGEMSLQSIAGNCQRPALLNYYRQILKSVILLHVHGASRALKAQLPMVAPFSADLYRWEREFFGRHFLASHLHLGASAIKSILTGLTVAGNELAHERRVLIHRDLQSSNIIFFHNKPFLIDFQGMRPGPAAYDLASLLCDPYISLSLKEQMLLLDFYNGQIGRRGKIARPTFWLAAVQRLAQALGAFGRLAAERGTERFARFIPPALIMMRRALEQAEICPRLYKNLC